METDHESPWVEPSRVQDAKRDLAVWACRWNRIRKRVLADPKAMLEDQLRFALAPEVEVRVHQEEPRRHYFVLPSWPAEHRAEDLVPPIVETVARGVLHSESPVPPSHRGESETGVVSIDPEVRVVARAWRDPDFLEQLRERTAETFAAAVGAEWPEDVELHLLEETSEVLHLVIPPAGRCPEGSESEAPPPGNLAAD